MKTYLTIGLALVTLLFNSCRNNEDTSLSAKAFESRLKGLLGATLLDVRTPEEFSNGHLINAVNYDWNGGEFENQIAPLDKSKPVFVYCLSGGRSALAANKMREMGFKEVYEMGGGLMEWRAENLPEAGSGTASGMTRQQFEEIVTSDKLVLVDFYADWCAPCKQMEPFLNEISKEMADKVVLVRINADENQALSRELKIEALPFLQLYKNKAMIWENVGVIDKNGVVKQLQK